MLGGLLLERPPSFAAQSAASVVRVPIEATKWVDEPDGLGFQTAVIEGDPTKAGIYVIRVHFPPHIMTRPHYHPEARYATVLKGTWYTGSGDTFEPDKTVPLKPGSFMKHPPGVHHYDGAKDEDVILQLIGMGPSATTRLHSDQGLFARSDGKQ